MKFSYNFDYDKLFLKKITILIPRYHNNLTSFLTPILGLYGINVKEFITEFESKSKFINFDVILPIEVKITKIKTYEISLKTPYVASILNSLNILSKEINLLTLYKLFLLKSVYKNVYILSYFYKLIYKNLRIYLSRCNKLDSLLIVHKSYLDYELKYLTTSNLLRNSLKNFLYLSKFFKSNFGLVVSFNIYNSYSLNLLKLMCSIFNIEILKIKNKILSIFFLNQLPTGHIFYLSAKKLANFYSFCKNIKIYNNSSWFNLFYKLNSNLVTTSFFTLYSSNTLFNNPQYYLVKCLKICQLQLPKSLNLNRLKFIKMIKNAYISSVNS